MSEPIKPVRSPDCTVTRSHVSAVGPLMVETPQGPVLFIDAPGLGTHVVRRTNGEQTIGLFVYDPVKGQGLVVQLDADAARVQAAVLQRQAGEIDVRLPS